MAENDSRPLPGRQISQLPSLRMLELLEAHPSADGWVLLSRLVHLEHLDLTDAAIADDDPRHFAGTRNLKRLNLLGTGIGDAGWAHFSPLLGIEELHLSGTRVTRLELRGLRELRGLSIAGTPLTELALVDLPKLAEVFNLLGAPLRTLRVLDVPLLRSLVLADTRAETIELRGLVGLQAIDLSR